MIPFLVSGTHPRLTEYEARLRFPELSWQRIDTVLVGQDIPHLPDAFRDLAGTVKYGEIIASHIPEPDVAQTISEWIIVRPRAERVLFSVDVVNSKTLPVKRVGMSLKRHLQEQGKSVRWVTSEQTGASSAAITKLDLISQGYDFTVIATKDGYSIGVTAHVQDIDTWSELDFGRPRRDAKNGMLPPKLAQMMVNMVGAPGVTLFDPFCGSGTIPLVAARVGWKRVIGTDLSSLQVKNTQENIAWAQARALVSSETRFETRILDATRLHEASISSVDAIATEGFLGTPLQGNESLDALNREAEQGTALWKAFLKSAALILPTDAPLLGIWPQYRSRQGNAQVDLTDTELSDLGFRFDPDFPRDLIYARPDQWVKRRLVRLIRL